MRLGEIQRVINDFNPMCLCLQHIGPKAVPIRNYQLASISPTVNGRLGTAIYVHNKVIYKTLNPLVANYQITNIKLFLPNNGTITIANIYNQPGFYSNFNDIHQLTDALPKPTLLVGDFNAHSLLWDDSHQSDPAGSNIEDFLTNTDFCCLNESDAPTHFSNAHNTFSSVDVSLCTADISERFKWNVCDDNYTSDHFPIILTYLNNNNDVPLPPRYNFSKADWDKYDLYTRSIPPFPFNQDFNELCDFTTTFISNSADKSIPKLNPNPTKSCVPWWSPTLSHLVNIRHALSRNLQRLTKRVKQLNNQPSLTTEIINKICVLNITIRCIKPLYNKYNAKFRKAVIAGKIQSWKKYVEGISNETSIQNMWHKIRKINGSYIRSPRSPIRINGNLYHNPKDIANIIGRHLENVSSITNMDDHFLRIKRRAERCVINFETLEDLEYNYAFSMDELEHALSTCTTSAPGPDNISFILIQKLAPLAKSFLLKFYNKLWLNNVFPTKWKHAIVIPIGKPGKDTSIPENHRPISLTNCLCKVLEKMINIRLTHVLESNTILTPTQSGSIAGRSTLEPLTCLEDSIRRGFERRKLTVAVFFDIKKAYDTTWRYSILKKLYTSGIRGHLPLFIQNFLSDRTFQTQIDSSLSDTFKLEEGIPQGSVLSCTLFALAINDITLQLPAGVQNSLYVDDFAIYYTSNSLRHAQRILNTAIGKITAWTDSVGFKFSVEKTNAIVFYKDKRWLKNQTIDLQLYNTSITFKESIKFLGIIFDQHLNWKPHLKHIKAKGISASNILKKLTHTTWGAKRSTMITIYKASVLSILDYCCPIYASASETSLKILDPVHHQGIRLCTGAFRSSPTISILAESGMLPLALRRNLITLQRSFSIQAGTSPASTKFSDLESFEESGNIPSFPIRALQLMKAHNIEPHYLTTLQLIPPWILKRPKICTGLSYLLKRNMYNPEMFRQHAIEHIRRKGNRYIIYTDGSKSECGVGAGVVFPDSITKVALPKTASIFTAELTAIECALGYTFPEGTKYLTIFTDSRSTLSAISQLKPKNKLVQRIQFKLHNLILSGYVIELCWIPAHVGIYGNETADQAAKEACSNIIIDESLPISDWATAAKRMIFQDWQVSWENQPQTNKLRTIKHNVYNWPTSNQNSRFIEVILTRLRIGHARFTHGHLMSTPHGPPMVCSTCNVVMTVLHLFVECPNFNFYRRLLFKSNTVKDILGEGEYFNLNRIILFLKHTKFLNNI